MLIKLESRTSDPCQWIDTQNSYWTWTDGGKRYSIDWTNYNIHSEFEILLKEFFTLRLKSKSLITVAHDIKIIAILDSESIFKTYPLTRNSLSKLIHLIENSKNDWFYSFKSLMTFFYAKDVPWLSEPDYSKIQSLNLKKEFMPNSRNLTYSNNLQKNIRNIFSYIESNNYKDYESFRNKCLLQVLIELGPRPIQIFAIDNSDVMSITVKNKKFYHINLPLAKKRTQNKYEKRKRKITNELGRSLNRLIELNKQFTNSNTNALFLKIENKSTVRLSRKLILSEVKKTLKSLNIEGVSVKDFRHYVGQSLANQGSPADVIAEILGHSTVLSAKAYIKATPELAKIKQEALNNNESYKIINQLILTGDISKAEDHTKNRWVSGTVHNQYIGGLGACNTDKLSHCNKNPIYACYNCVKFQPFRDAPHLEVKNKLIEQVNLFIDSAEKANSIMYNRTITQLKSTIEEVDLVINRCHEQ